MQATPAPAWSTLWGSLEKLDASACAAIEAGCARYRDEEREVPRACRQALLAGGDPPAALRLCRTLDWRNFTYERTSYDEDIDVLFARMMRLPVFHGMTRLVLADEAKYLTTEILDGYTSLEVLAIHTREAFTSAIRDEHCGVIGDSVALRGLESLIFNLCDISGKGLARILRSAHLGPISSLGLYVPARTPLLTELSRATKVLQGLSMLGLSADRLNERGATALAGARASLGGIRLLRIVAAETGGYDWETPFGGYDGERNVRQLAKALVRLLPAFEGLEQLEIVHGVRSEPRITTKDELRALTTIKDLRARAFPASMG